MIKHTLIVHLILTALGALVAFNLGTAHNLGSFVWGAVIAGTNLVTLIWAWRQIIFKKRVAWAGGVIVIKYPILIAGIYWLISSRWVDANWFLIGLSVFIPSVLLAATWQHKADSAAKTII